MEETKKNCENGTQCCSSGKDEELGAKLDEISLTLNRIAAMLEKRPNIEATPLEGFATLQSSTSGLDEVTLELLKGWIKHKVSKHTKSLSKKIGKATEDILALRHAISDLEDEEIELPGEVMMAMIGIMGDATSKIFSEISRKVGAKDDLGEKFKDLIGTRFEELGLNVGTEIDEDEESGQNK